ncbi:MAG: hypothetical protein [Siphoviridae sp. ctjeG17]|nr:MAG: hypothetical protein [Siphoviridae sp. ctjeG17]
MKTNNLRTDTKQAINEFESTTQFKVLKVQNPIKGSMRGYISFVINFNFQDFYNHHYAKLRAGEKDFWFGREVVFIDSVVKSFAPTYQTNKDKVKLTFNKSDFANVSWRVA